MGAMEAKARRPRRNPEEDIPCIHYAERLKPRDREALVTYYGRVASVNAQRQLWIETLQDCGGDFNQVCIALGIPVRACELWLHRVGLTRDIVRKLAFAAGHPQQQARSCGRRPAQGV